MTETVCAVIPMFNEGTVLHGVLAGLLPHVDEVICIDDGSTDGSQDLAVRAGATVLRHSVNLGQGAALQTGFDYVMHHTTHQHVITFDADGQHRPEDAIVMLNTAREQHLDVVLGTRIRAGTAIPRTRRLIQRGALWFSRRTTGLALTDTHNGLRVLSRLAVSGLRITQPGMAHASELEAGIARLGLTWVEVPVSIMYDAYSLSKGQSNINAVNVVYDLAIARLRAVT